MKNKREGVTFGLSAIIVIGLILSIINHQQATPTQSTKDSTSISKTITLHNIAPGSYIGQGETISGFYKPVKDETLSYKCVNSKGAVVANGDIIANSSGHFVRELDFTKAPQQNEAITLEIFSQNHRGKQIDLLSIDARYQ